MDGFDTESQHIHISLLPPDICALPPRGTAVAGISIFHKQRINVQHMKK